MWRKSLIFILAMVSVGSMLTQPALGKEYPTKPIEVIVPYTPGSSLDLLSRIVADTAPNYLGQSVIVVNTPGAGGSIAAAEIIASKPDGYKLFTTSNNFFAFTTKTQKVPFNPSYLTPIVNFTQFRVGICVRGDSPWKTFNDLLDYAKKNPGKLRWAHIGRGTVAHVPFAFIFKKAGVETIDVPYKGTPEFVAALLGGHVDAFIISWAGIRDHVIAGNIRYLTFVSDKRYRDIGDPRFSILYDIPSVAELGFPEVAPLITTIGFYAHKDTPEEARKILFDAFKKTYEDPGWHKRVEKLGDEFKFGGPEFMKESIKRSEEISIPLLKEMGLYVGK
jgi:tripartite-type tricarboxylate transporter receptor subunit TctC